MKIAVVGSGISGLSAALCLHKAGHQVFLMEKAQRFGGHSYTVDISLDEKRISVDMGFIVFNGRNYPHLIDLFNYLGVQKNITNMSFSVAIASANLEFGSGLKRCLGQKRNFLKPDFWLLLKEIHRFNKVASSIELMGLRCSLATFLKNHNFQENFFKQYLYPMGGAIWSTPIDKMTDFPAATFIQFFKNHGLLQMTNHPQWMSLVGGSKTYVDKILAFDFAKIQGCTIKSILRDPNHITLNYLFGENLESLVVDKLIFATPADLTLEMLGKIATEDEKNLLSCFSYNKNVAYLHSDNRLMPKQTKCWASWNYFSTKQQTMGVTYWMNSLQKLDTKKNIFVTLNPEVMVDKVYHQKIFYHPVFNATAIQAQQHMQNIQGKNNTYFCGAYLKYGFHEDGIWSALNVCEKLGVKPAWQ